MAIVAIVILIVIATALVLRSRGGMGQKPKTSKTTSHRIAKQRLAQPRHPDCPYQAVSIRPQAHACRSILSLVGTRFLVAEAPFIPPVDCSAEVCHCKYLHHDHRRDVNDDRRATHSLRTELYGDTGSHERRETHGRRAADAT